MAEALATGGAEVAEEQDKECAVCLQPYVHPAQLPCGHIFCFLCIKGTANQSKRCAMCRQEIPQDFIEKPNLVKNKIGEEDIFEGCYQWFYEGRNGWWQYDERTSKELEASYKSGQRTCELLVAGFLYVMDFEAWVQLRRNDPLRRRRIKRDLATIDKKGVAGLRIPKTEICHTTNSSETLSTTDGQMNIAAIELLQINTGSTSQTNNSQEKSFRAQVEETSQEETTNASHVTLESQK